MKKIFLSSLLFFAWHMCAFEQLSDSYLVKYGEPQASVQIIQYYSFTCPHCIALFRKQFQQIKETYIDTGKIAWIFHPVPMDLLTVQGMECLSKLSEREKKIFIEAILEELFIDHPKLSAQLMQKAMELLSKPINALQEKAYLSETTAFQDAFQFLQQAEEIEAVPSVDVNGRFLSAQIPDIDFIEAQLISIGGQ